MERRLISPGMILKKRKTPFGLRARPGATFRDKKNLTYWTGILVEDDIPLVVLYRRSPVWFAVLIGDKIGLLETDMLNSNLFSEWE